MLGAFDTTLCAVEVTVCTGEAEDPPPELGGCDVELVLEREDAGALALAGGGLEAPEPVPELPLGAGLDDLGPDEDPLPLGARGGAGADPWPGDGVAAAIGWAALVARLLLPVLVTARPPGAAVVARDVWNLTRPGVVTPLEVDALEPCCAEELAERFDCGVLAIATDCGECVLGPITPSATSAQVAATTAVPSTAAGRERTGGNLGAPQVHRGRLLCGGEIGGRDGSGSQLVCEGDGRACSAAVAGSASHRGPGSAGRDAEEAVVVAHSPGSHWCGLGGSTRRWSGAGARDGSI